MYNQFSLLVGKWIRPKISSKRYFITIPNCLAPRSVNATRKISCAVCFLRTPLGLASLGPWPQPDRESVSESVRTPEPAQQNLALELLPFSIKEGACQPLNTECKAPRIVTRNTRKSALAWCVCNTSPLAGGLVPLGPVAPRGGLGVEQLTGGLQGVLCFALGHLEGVREPASANIPSEYFELQSSLVVTQGNNSLQSRWLLTTQEFTIFRDTLCEVSDFEPGSEAALLVEMTDSLYFSAYEVWQREQLHRETNSKWLRRHEKDECATVSQLRYSSFLFVSNRYEARLLRVHVN